MTRRKNTKIQKPGDCLGKNEKEETTRAKSVQESQPGDQLQILAEEVASKHGGEVAEMKVRDGVLVVLLTDGRKFKVDLQSDQYANASSRSSQP